jgi:predicted permease
MFLGLGLDIHMLGFTMALAAGTCLVFGLLPALRATRVAPAAAMRAGGRGLSAGRERSLLRRALVATQVALSMALLVGALLFVRSLQNLLTIDPGFRPEGVIAFELNFRNQHYSKQQFTVTRRDLLDRIHALPGVRSAAEVNIVPLEGSSWNRFVHPDGVTDIRQNAYFNQTGPGFFQTMAIPLVAGRDFDERDATASPKVAIVNEAFARTVFNGTNPLGHSFRVEEYAGKPDSVYQIVGLTRNSKYQELREDLHPIAYLAMSQAADQDGSTVDYVLRMNGPVKGVLAAVKASVAGVSPGIGIEFWILTERIKETLLRDRLMATLSGAFGLLAGILATLGLYGVMAYMVARRRNEIGVRMALGADRAHVVRMVLREAGFLLAAGLVIGTGLALWLGRAATSLLYGLKPYDATALAGAIAALITVGLVASYGPARRAAGVHPIEALREE